MNKYKFYKPDFDTEEGRKIFYAKVWGLIKYIFILLALFFVLLFVTLGVATSNLQESESALAEVSSLAVNTQYYIDSLIPASTITTSSDNFSDSGFSGTIQHLTNSASFNKISLEYIANPRKNNFSFYNGSTVVANLSINITNNPHYFYSISFYNFSTSSWDIYSFDVSTYDESILISFTSLGNNTRFINTFKKCLSVYVPPVVVPDSPVLETAGDFSISIIGKYYNLDVSSSEWYTNNNVFVMLKCDYADSFYNSDYHGVLLKLRMYDAAENLVFDEEIVGYMDYPTDQYAYFIILIPSYNPQIGPVNISKFETYVPGDTTNIVTYSLLENTATYNALVSSMNAITEFTDDTMTLGHIYGYNLGYQTGLETDKTLLSVMWQTFNLPFRLLFGTYDDTPGSFTYGHYVGGLFNFTILGVDIRAFCIGIMSFAIVLAVVRVVLGSKG